MYFADVREQPQFVRLALDALRVKIVSLRANFHGEATLLAGAIEEIEGAILDFFGKLTHIHIDNITVTSGNPEFEAFAAELNKIRSRIKASILPVAQAEGFEFQRIEFS